MCWVPVAIASLAAYLLYKTDHTALMVVSTICAAGAFWSWGIMHNFAVEEAKRHRNYSGGFYDLTREEVYSVLNWLVVVNMVCLVLGVVLLVCGGVFLLWT